MTQVAKVDVGVETIGAIEEYMEEEPQTQESKVRPNSLRNKEKSLPTEEATIAKARDPIITLEEGQETKGEGPTSLP